MKKNILIIMMGMFLLVSFTALTSAQIQYWQTIWQGDGVGDVPYNVTRNHAFVIYDKDIDDYVKGNNPLEIYVMYDIYIDTWNSLNSADYSVDWCNLTIRTFPASSNLTSLDYNQLFTDDYRNSKYFVQLNDGDNFFVDLDCHFNSTQNSINVPASFQIVTPSWECKACQYYEWSVVEQDIVKSQSVGSNVVEVSEYTKKLIELNYELWLVLFWVILIIIAVHSTGLIFIGLLWLFIFMKGLTK